MSGPVQLPGASMGMSGFQITPAEILAGQASTVSTAESISGELASLQKYVMSLEAVWGGIAKNAFDDLMVEYNNYAQQLHRVLTEIADGLGHNYQNYTGGEQGNIRNIQSVQTNLPAPRF